MARSPCIRPADILLRRLRRLRAHPMVISAQATRGSELGGPKPRVPPSGTQGSAIGNPGFRHQEPHEYLHFRDLERL